MAAKLLQFGQKIKSNGATVIEAKLYNDNPRDAYLQYVLARYHSDYVVWTYNSQTGGCSSGHYFTRLSCAVYDYDNRGK